MGKLNKLFKSKIKSNLIFSNRRRLSSIDSQSQASPCTPSEMLSVVGESLKRTSKPKVKTMSERDLTKRHSNCFTRSNGYIF